MVADLFHSTPWETRWELVRFRGSWLLERSAFFEPILVANGLRTHWLRLRLWLNPAGLTEAEPRSLSVFEPFDATSNKTIVREAVWLSRRDWQRFHGRAEDPTAEVSLEPTFSVRDAEVPADAFLAILRAGSELLVPLLWMDETESVTSDVGDMGFEFYSRDQPPAVLRLSWSWETPERWNPVKEWVTRLQDFLMDCLQNAP